MDDLAFRAYRIPFKHVALCAGACLGIYAAVAAFGAPAVIGLGGISAGYLVARLTRK